MNENEHEVTLIGLETEDAMEVGSSIADRLRSQRDKAAKETTYDIDIPDYGGELFCRYRLLSGDENEAIIAKVRQEARNRNDQGRLMALDNLIEACEEFYLREKGTVTPLREHSTYTGDKQVPVRYDANLAEYLRFDKELPDPPTARSVVLALFVGNELAVTAHAALLGNWMVKGNSDLAQMLGGG